MVVTDTTDPSDAAGCGTVRKQARNRLFLVDLVAGDRRLLRDCDAALVVLRWLDDRYVTLLQVGSGTEDVSTGVLLLDVATGELRPLTPELEYLSHPVHAPDERRFLVTGRQLRLFAADGALLRVIEPPPGLEIVEAAWSPDGSQFVYIARTRGVSQYE
jgi:hypothetical protein